MKPDVYDSTFERAGKRTNQPVNLRLEEASPGVIRFGSRTWSVSFVMSAITFGLLGCCICPSLNSGVNAQRYVPTYYVDVQPILEKNCVSCHTAGGIAPFSLETPEAAVKRASQIAAIVQSGSMPPWPPGSDSPAFLNPRKLGEASKQMLVDWAKAGAPLGKK
jgi:hypothetical protein